MYIFEGGIQAKKHSAFGSFLPSAWGTGYIGLEVGKVGNGVMASTTTPEISLVSNLYWDGSNWKYGSTDEASALTLDSSGRLRWFSCPSGTAGNNATLTERFQVDNSGNVGVRVTPPTLGSGWYGISLENAGNGIYASGTVAAFAGNLYWNGTNWTTGTTGYGNMMYTNGGVCYFYGTGNTTAGSAATLGAWLTGAKATTVALEGGGLHDGTGITFPATQYACANANTLDDYEEGTWTPSSGTANVTIVPAVTAQYTKVGRQVTFTAYINITNSTGGTIMGFVVNGLPFNCKGSFYGWADSHYPGYGSEAYSYVQASASYVIHALLTTGYVVGATSAMISGSYFTD